MSWRDRAIPVKEPTWKKRAIPVKETAAKPKPKDDPSLWETVKEGLRSAPGGIGVGLGLGNYLDRRAASGVAVEDAAKDEGFLDRSGSLLERGTQSAKRGVVDAVGGVTGSDSAQRYSQTLGRVAGMEVAGDTSWEDVKADPSLGNVGSFVLNRGIESAPLMATAALPVAGLPIVATSGTGMIARSRADADGREEVTGTDVAIAAPFGVGSAFLERLGLKGIGSAPAKTSIGRVGQAAAGEAATEFTQSALEYTGGSVGTKEGFRLSELLDQSAGGALAGAGIGGGIRGGIELATLPERRVAKGKIESGAPVITPEDEASPLPTELIAAGKTISGLAVGQNAANTILSTAGLPKAGSRIKVSMPDGTTRFGSLTDAFDEDVEGERASGVVVDLDDGTRLREHFDTLADAGVIINELSLTEQADDLDALLGESASVSDFVPDFASGPAPVQAAPVKATVARSVLSAPVTGRISSGFGMRKSPKKGASSNHGGTDYAVAVGTDVTAAGDGYVKRVFWDKKGGGNVVEVDHGGGVVTQYMHLKGAKLAVGAKVRQGDVIAASGNTGNSTGPHLHFALKINGQNVNPQEYMGKEIGGGTANVRGGEPAAVEPAAGEPSRIDFGPGPDFGDGPAIEQRDTQYAPIRRGEPINVVSEEQADVAVTSAGREVPVRYAVAELADLVTSNDADGRRNPNYPAELQPRDRSRGISAAQIGGIAGNLNPRLIGRSPKASDGAPIIAPDGIVESGNGRTLALAQAYQTGGAKIDAYKQMIEAEGFDTAGFQQPVLVRVRDGELSGADVQAFTREANARDTLDMSATETAMADAQGLSADMIESYRGGDIDSGGNRAFVRSFLSSVVSSPNDFAKLIDGEGRLSQAAVQRVRGALLARAYGNEGLVGQAIESTDSEIKNIVNALTDVSGQWSKMREAAGDGFIDGALDITDNLNEAVALVDRARREGKRVADLVGQRDIFTGESVSPTTEAVLRLFFSRPDFTRPTGRERVVTALNFYAEEALKASTSTAALFDMPAVEATGVLDLARVKQGNVEETPEGDLFRPAAAERPEPAAGADAPEAGPERRPSGEGLPRDDSAQAGSDVDAPAADDGAGVSAADRTNVPTSPDKGPLDGRTGAAPTAASPNNAPDNVGRDSAEEDIRDDVLAVVDATNAARNAKHSASERLAFRVGAARALGVNPKDQGDLDAVVAEWPAAALRGKSAANFELKRRMNRLAAFREPKDDKAAGAPLIDPKLVEQIIATGENPAQEQELRERVREIQNVPLADIEAVEAQPVDEAATRLLVQAALAVNIDDAGKAQVVRIARALAALAGTSDIHRIHIAEALSYSREYVERGLADQPERTNTEIKKPRKRAVERVDEDKSKELKKKAAAIRYPRTTDATAPQTAGPVIERARNVYKYIKARGAENLKSEVINNADLWMSQIEEQIENPNRFHPVTEFDNLKGLRVGDRVEIVGEPDVEAYLVSIANVRQQIQYKVARLDAYGGWTDVRPYKGDVAQQTSADLAGDKIKGEWVAFAEDSGSLGIPRGEMPQIKAEHRGALVNFLNARGIAHEEINVPASELKPTQAEFSTKKVEKAKAYEGGDRAILSSADGHVVDGHHQWLAKMDNGEEIRAIRLDAPIRDLLATVAEFPSAETAGGAAPVDKPTPSNPAELRAALQDSVAEPTAQPDAKIEEKAQPEYGAANRIVSAERAEELRKRLKEKLNPNRLNAGVDPELLAIGTELAIFHIEAGARRFKDFAQAVASDLDMPLENLRRYLRGWYNGARDTMEDMGESVVSMDSSDEVAAAMRQFAEWSTTAPEPAIAAGDGLQTDLSGSDANAGPGDVQGIAQDRSDGGAPGQEVEGSPRTAERSDRGAGEAAQRPSARSERTAGSGRTSAPRDAGLFDFDAEPVRTGSPAPASLKGKNFAIEPGSLGESRTPAVKAADNLAAIRIVKELDRDGRVATAEEQAAIARYVGWGGLKNAFAAPDGSYGKGFESIGPQLRELLTDEEYDTARRSIQYAHYTAEKVVRQMWDLVRQFGFTGGSVFEPGMGTGNFAGMMPREIAANTRYQGIEYDHLTSRIAFHLYPEWGVKQADYTKMPQVMDAFDLVIGNPPFAQTIVSSDPAYQGKGFVLHDYFFAKSLDAVRPGGLLMFVTSAGTMNKVTTTAREYLADRADLVGAIRLPGNAFTENAGTSVTTDIVILQKRLDGAAPASRDWVETVTMEMPDRTGNSVKGAVSRYFADNPTMVLGEQGMFDQLVSGVRYAVRAPKGYDLAKNLALAAAKLPAGIMGAPKTIEARAKQDFDIDSGEKKEGSFYIADGKLMQFSGGAGRPVERKGKGVAGGQSAAAIERIRGLVPVRDALRAVYAADLAGQPVAAEAARKQLNTDYDRFVRKFGPINKADISYRRPNVIQQESARNAAREEERLAGRPWDEGSFDPSALIAAGSSLSEISRARVAARDKAKAEGRDWSEGTFDPDDMPDIVIDKRPNIEPFMDDQEGYRLRAIEHYNDDTGEAKKGLVFFENVITKERPPEINSVNDGLLFVLNKLGRPDIAEIAAVSGKSQREVLDELGDSVFPVPGAAGGTFQTREQYLSGNVREKLAEARAAAERDPLFERNVSALEAVQPAPLGPADIAANLGMPWLPPEVIEQFGTEGLGLKELKVKYVPKLGEWSVGGDHYSANAKSVWGTPDREAPLLIWDALRRTTPQIYREGPDKTRVLDATATQAAQDKLLEVKAKFAEWVWEDQARTDRLVKLYNEEYNSLVAPQYDGSYLTTPGIASTWSWRPHQTAVVARIIQTGNTYMAHAVGAGKTSAMIGAGMEMRRLGLVKKPIYAVPNHMLGQFTKEFYEQYPTARIMVADERQFHTSRRKQFIANVASEDLDAVIITHSAFGFIPLSTDFTDKLIDNEISEYRSILSDISKDGDNRFTRRNIEQRIEALEQRLSGKNNRKRDDVFTFEEMGVDFLFVDEAHLFRKLDFTTKMSNVKGVTPLGSKMAFDLFSKIRYLESKTPGRAAVLASGTPITNTMAELFSLSRFLQLGELKKRNIAQFDAWSGAFGDTVTALEQDPAGGYKSVTRFAKFVNVPELSVMVRQIMDVVTPNDLEKYVTRPQLKGGKRQMIVVEQTEGQSDYQEVLKYRMKAIQARTGKPEKGQDIILSVIGDGRKSAIDYRLINADAPKEASKLEAMIDGVFDIWKKTKRQPFHKPEANGYSAEPVDFGPAAQMIFADFGINGDFPVHKYIVAELARRGVPKGELAIISDYKSHVARQRLFNDMNEGKVRVLIGSVAKMGTGVNAQKRLYAVHNMDAQWYPANDEQRNGRIIRQGNMNPEIEIRDYSTKGTYDSTMWGMMANKARFIEGFMRGDPNLRSMDDLGEASQYEQAKAMTTADPRIMELTEWKQDLEKALRRRSAHDRSLTDIRQRLDRERFTIEQSNKRIAALTKDIARRTDIAGDAFTGKVGGKTYDKRAEFGEAILAKLDDLTTRKNVGKPEQVIGEVGGFELSAETVRFGDDVEARLYVKYSDDFYTAITALESATGLVTSISSKLLRLDSDLADNKGKVARAEKAIEEFTPQLDKTFTGNDEIRELMGRINEMETLLEKESKPAEQTLIEAIEEGAEVIVEGKAIDGTGNVRDVKESRVEASGGNGAAVLGLNPKSIAALRAQMQQLGIQDKIALRVADNLGPMVAGRFTPVDVDGAKGLIEIAAGDLQPKDFTLRHEAIHAMRSLGLFRDPEWMTLSKRAKSNPVLMRSVKRRYPSLTAEQQIEEAVADMFANWAASKNQKGLAARALERIVDFVTALRGWFKGEGWTNAAAVLRAIEGGDIGARQNSAPVNDPADPDIRNSMVSAVKAIGKGSAFKGKAADLFDRWRQGFQDRYLPLLRTQQAIEAQTGAPLREGENPYLKEELMTGRIGNKLEKLTDDYMDPLFEAMNVEGVTVEELETYLYARHAQERNARIAEINPQFDEGMGSGMTDFEAMAILNRVERSGRKEALDRVAAFVDRIRDFTLEQRVETGLMSEADVKAWREIYKDYVPLRGREELDGDVTEEEIRSSVGITVRGKEDPRAFGRISKADNILAYTMLQAERAIVRGETNQVAQAFYRLAQDAPDPDFWLVDKVTRKRVMDPVTGLVLYENQTHILEEDRDYTVTAKFEGAEHRVTMSRQNPSATRLAIAMRHLSQHQTDFMVHVLGKVNRFLSAVNTSYNPEFVVTNAFRDIQTAAINLVGFDRDGLVSGTLRDYRKALVAATRGAFKSGKGDEWSDWYDEFNETGARVSFNHIEDINAMKKRVEQAVEAAADGNRLKVKTMFFKVRDVVEATNSGVENAVRLSAYKNAREVGMSKAQAASLAKNLTVNFNRRGSFGPAMNAAYLFFNASVQGSARLFLAMRSPKVRKVLAGVVVSGAMIELMNAMVSGDDEDGESFYDKISAFDKGRNMIFMLPDGKSYIKLPLPYGYNAFYGLGRTMAEITRRGGDRAGESMGELGTTIVDAFNPVGGTDSLLNFFAPTIVDPIVDLERNKDFAGRPIMPEQNPFEPEQPDAQRYYGSVGAHWKAVTDFLTSASGGDDVVAGAIDVSPETLEHMAGVVMGAAGSFIDRNVDLGIKMFTGEEEVTAGDLPFARKVIGKKANWYDKSAFYDRVKQVEQAITQAEEYEEREDFDRLDRFVADKEKLIGLEGDMKAAQKEMRGIRKARAANNFAKEMDRITAEDYRAEATAIKDAETLVVTDFNTAWNAVMTPRGDNPQ